ncbi:MAG: aminoglycoside 3'-phosphotransferase/choline kinase family protein [Planctomycetota bacterium]
MQSFPEIRSEAEADAFLASPANKAAALGRLVDHLGWRDEARVPARGSAVVGVGHDEVLKLMVPIDAELSASEAACLAALDGALPVPTPKLLDRGELDGWPWIRMSRLPGEELVEVWPDLDAPSRIRLAEQLGRCLRALHELPAPDELPRVDWTCWVEARLGRLEAQQRSRGCPEELLHGLDEFVAGSDIGAGRETWLHTEVMLEHLLVRRTDEGWELSGLIDFEPSWVGPQDYEFASVGLFVSRGDASVLGAVLRAVGIRPSARRLFSMAMLHRYANLGWYHERLGGPSNVAEIAEAWFGTGSDE